MSFLWLIAPPATTPEIVFYDFALYLCSFFFSSIFLVEIMLKMFAQSVFFSENSFFRRNALWNTIDVTIVLVSFMYSLIALAWFLFGSAGALLLTIMMNGELETSFLENFIVLLFLFRGGDIDEGNSKLMRFVSILRLLHFLLPFRFMTFISVVRILTESMVASTPFVLAVLFLGILVIAGFSIVGMSSFMGIFHRRCVSNTNGIIYEKFRLCSIENPQHEAVLEFAYGKTPFQTLVNGIVFAQNWYERYIFTNSGLGLGGKACPEGYSCVEDKKLHPNPNHKLTGFDNGPQSFFTVFEILTGDVWFELMFQAIDGTNIGAMGFFLILMMIGGFLMTNFVLVIISKLVSHRIRIFESKGQTDPFMRSVRKTNRTISTILGLLSEYYEKIMNQITPKPIREFQLWLRQMYNRNPIISKLTYSTSSCATLLNCFFFYGQPPWLKSAISTFGNISLCVSTIDFCVCMVSVGPKDFYTRDYFNIMDSISFSISWVQVFYALPPTISSTIKIYRFYKFIKIGRRFSTIKKIYHVVLDTISWIFAITALMFLFLCGYALTGHYVFGDLSKTKQNYDVLLAHTTRESFDSFWSSFMTCFQIITAEEWSELTFKYMESHGYISAVFFVSLHVFGRYGINSLFIAIMLFYLSKIYSSDRDKYEDRASFKDNLRAFSKYFQQLNTRKDLNDPKDQEQEESVSVVRAIEIQKGDASPSSPTDENSMYHLITKTTIFNDDEKKKKRERRLRDLKILWQYLQLCYCPYKWVSNFCTKFFVKTAFFEGFVFMCILLNCAFLLLENPYLIPDSPLAYLIFYVNISVSVLFILEFVVKLFSFGPIRYFLDPWNIVDFIVMNGSLLSIFVTIAFKFGFVQKNLYLMEKLRDLELLNSVKLLRLLRVLRPLRLVHFNQHVKILVDAFFSSIVWIANAAVFVFLIWLIFAITGVNIYYGSFYACYFFVKEKNLDKTYYRDIVNAPRSLFGIQTNSGSFVSFNNSSPSPLFFEKYASLPNDNESLAYDPSVLSRYVGSATENYDSQEKEQDFVDNLLSILFSNSKSVQNSEILEINSKKKNEKPWFLNRLLKSKTGRRSRNLNLNLDLNQPLSYSPRAPSDTSYINKIVEIKYPKWSNYGFINFPPQIIIPNKKECLRQGGKWKTYPFNFDNVLNAFMTLFQVTSTEGWTETLFTAVDSVGVEKSPSKNYFPYSGIFFVLFFVAGNFFTLSLFSVVLIQNFIVLKQTKKRRLIQKKRKGIRRNLLSWIFFDLEFRSRRVVPLKQQKENLKKEAAKKFSSEKSQSLLAEDEFNSQLTADSTSKFIKNGRTETEITESKTKNDEDDDEDDMTETVTEKEIRQIMIEQRERKRKKRLEQLNSQKPSNPNGNQIEFVDEKAKGNQEKEENGDVFDDDDFFSSTDDTSDFEEEENEILHSLLGNKASKKDSELQDIEENHEQTDNSSSTSNYVKFQEDEAPKIQIKAPENENEKEEKTQKKRRRKKQKIDFVLKKLKANAKWNDILGFLNLHFYEKRTFVALSHRKRLMSYCSPSKLFHIFYNSGFLDILFAIVTFANLLLLFFDFYQQPGFLFYASQSTNVVFTILFMLEFAINWYENETILNLVWNCCCCCGIFSFLSRTHSVNTRKKKYEKESIVLFSMDLLIILFAILENFHFFYTCTLDGILNLFDFCTFTQLKPLQCKIDPSALLFLTMLREYTSVLKPALIYRTIRVLRIFRVTQFNATTSLIFATVYKAVPEFFYLFLLYLLVCFIYSIAGVGLYGKLSTNIFSNFKYSVTIPNTDPKSSSVNPYFFLVIPSDVVSVIPDFNKLIGRPIAVFTENEHTHFSGFLESFITILRISTGGNWDQILSALLMENDFCSKKLGNCPPLWIFSIFYFLSFLIVVFVLVNLLTAIILSNFSELFDVYEKLTSTKARLKRELNLSKLEAIEFWITENLFALKKNQKVLMNEVHEKTERMNEVTGKYSEFIENIMKEIDDIWTGYCVNYPGRVKFSFELKVSELGTFLDHFAQEYNILLDFLEKFEVENETNDDKQLKKKFFKKFGKKIVVDPETMTLNYENIMFLIFEENFKQQSR